MYIIGTTFNSDDLITFWSQQVKGQGHSMTEYIPDFADYVFGSKGQSSRSHHRGGGAQHSTLPSSATFSSLLLLLSMYVLSSTCD